MTGTTVDPDAFPVTAGSPRGPLLGSLREEAAASAAGQMSTRRLQRQQVLYRRGDPAHELFVVQSGTVAIAHRAGSGREALFALMGDGDLFGLCSLFDGSRRWTDARALEPTTVLAVPYGPIRQVLEHRPALLWGMVGLLADRLRSSNQALADSTFLDVTARTAKRLLELAGDAEEFQLPITQEELAALVGASRERVNKALSTFLRLGWITQRDRRYRIVERGQLVRRADLSPDHPS